MDPIDISMLMDYAFNLFDKTWPLSLFIGLLAVVFFGARWALDLSRAATNVIHSKRWEKYESLSYEDQVWQRVKDDHGWV